MAFLDQVRRRLGDVTGLRTMVRQQDELRQELNQLRRQLLQYHLQLGRLARAVDNGGAEPAREPQLRGEVPVDPSDAPSRPWAPVGDGVRHPDPHAREWEILETCAVCGHDESTVVCPWNKLLLLDKAPDGDSARYDYSVCHGCGILFARRRPHGARYRFLLEHFGEVTAKRGGGREITNPLLNPYPLADEDRETLRRLASRGVFVSNHLDLPRTEHLSGLARDRFESSGHVDILTSLLSLDRPRVLEVRSRTGAILDGLRRHWQADVHAMPIWESQQFLVQEVYGIPATTVIDFDTFRIPFDEPFDLIIAQHMLTHVLHPRAFFQELTRCLKPGGYLYLHNEPHDEEFLAGKQSMIATMNPLHVQAFDQESLTRGLAANGFETVFLTKRELTHVCLARRAQAAMAPLGPKGRTRRIGQYRRAYVRAMLHLDEGTRSRVGSEWQEVVAEAVASGLAEFDRSGKLRLTAR